MKTSEVRIGNIVLMQNDNGSWNPVVIDLPLLIKMSEHEDKFRPQPIKDKWLTEVGFLQNEAYLKINSYFKPLIAWGTELNIIRRGHKEFIALITRSADAGDHMVLIRDWATCSNTSTHYIQNLYHSICGKELA